MWNQFIPGAFHAALYADGSPWYSQAMTSKASTPNEIESKFTQVYYAKGENHAVGS